MTTKLTTSKKLVMDRSIIAGILFISLIILPDVASAAPWDNALQTIIGFIQSGTGRLLAILAIIIVGILMLFGQLEKKTVAFIVLGIALIFGAVEIVDLFIGSIGTI